MVRRFLRWQLGEPEKPAAQTTPVKSDVQLLIEFQREANAQQHEHISNLISTLDKIVTAKYDRHQVDTKPTSITPHFPAHLLSDVLSDTEFLEQVTTEDPSLNA